MPMILDNIKILTAFVIWQKVMLKLVSIQKLLIQEKFINLVENKYCAKEYFLFGVIL